MSVTWGGTCFRDGFSCNAAKGDSIGSIRATGYAFIIVCLFFLLATLGILYHLRQAEIFGTGRSLLPSSTSAYPPSSSSYPSSSPSYPPSYPPSATSGETVPATSSSDNSSST